MGQLIQLPHGIDHRPDVRVQDVGPEVRVAGEVKYATRFGGIARRYASGSNPWLKELT
jgi:hypothetical protein